MTASAQSAASVRADRIGRSARELWTAHDLECAVLLAPMGCSFNGYVRLPDDHGYRKLGYDDIPVDVHGGLTYGADVDGWVGFDTMHGWDIWSEVELERAGVSMDERARRVHDGMFVTSHPQWRQDWSLERLKGEVESLAKQLAGARGC